MSDVLRLELVPRVAYGYIRLLGATMRLDFRGREVVERLEREGRHYILAFWHERFVMMPYVYPGSRIVVLLSESRDARMLSRILERFGLAVAFGSSTRGGVRGLRELLQHVRDGSDVGIAPDGPRGPARRAKPGVIAAARLGGLPIVPVTFAARPARRLGSWDRTLLPLPFSRGLFLYGQPLEIPRRAADDDTERWRSELERCLDALTDSADAELGVAAKTAGVERA